MKNKIVNTVLIALLGATCFSGGVYYGLERSEHYLESVMTEYEVISDKVDAFEKVSDPKTIRLYVKELNKLLDDISFLSKLIQTGQLADDALDDYLEEQQGNLDGLKETLSSITTEVDSMLISSHDHMHIMVEELQDSVKTQLTNSTSEVTSKVDELNKQIISLLKSIDTVTKDINVVKKSRYGKKIWENTNK